jgi:hypothetical protein
MDKREHKKEVIKTLEIITYYLQKDWKHDYDIRDLKLLFDEALLNYKEYLNSKNNDKSTDK